MPADLVFRDPGLDDAALQQVSEILAAPLVMPYEEALHDPNHVCGAAGGSFPERPRAQGEKGRGGWHS